MHCSSYFQSKDVHAVDLNKLQPMVYHMDHRWKTRDLPSIKKYGLWLPLLYYKVTPEWWNTNYFSNKGAYDYWELINPPVVNEDGMIWAVKSGVDFATAMNLIFSDEEMAIFASIIGFWFGSRHWDRHR